MTVMRSDVVRAARSYIGTPFHHQGRSRVGMDCAGLVICVARDLGIVPKDFDVPAYPRRADGSTMIALCVENMESIALDDMLPGDVIVVAVRRDPQHMGFVGDYRYGGFSIIHAASRRDGKGEVVETRLMFARNQQYRAAFRIRVVQ